MTTLTLDEALADITHATYRRWIEHDTPGGNWSRRRFQETENVINREQIRYLIGKEHPSEKRRYKRGTPLPVRIVVEYDKGTRHISTLEYHSE